jgi:hypothetical protein
MVSNPFRRFALSSLLVANILALSARPSFAQLPSRYAAFFGYSSRSDVAFVPVSSIPISVPHVETLHGWSASFEARLLPFLGVVADGGGYYGSYGATAGCEAILICVPVSGEVRSSMHTFMIGPQASIRFWRLTPFIHVLFGVAHISHQADVLELNLLSNSNTSFAEAYGGGIDIRIVSIVNWRFQADVMQTRFFGLPAPLGLILGPQYGIRGSTGVVVRF